MRHINEEPPSVATSAPTCAAPRRRRSAGRWRSGPRTGSRRWMRSARSSRRASPSCRRPARSSLVRPRRASARRQHRPRVSPWPLLARAGRPGRGGRGRGGLVPAQRLEVEVGEGGGAGGIRPDPCGRGVRPIRRRRRARLARGKATDGNRHMMADRELSDCAELGKPGVGLVIDAGAPVSSTSSGFSTSTPGLTAEILAR